MKIIITGSSGQVGLELKNQFSSLGHILAPSRQELDLSDLQAVNKYLDIQQPELILNAAAYTAVDKAEEEKNLARQINAELPALLADYSTKNQITLVHFSTDYVYSGEGTTPWQEQDTPVPLNIYGQTKLAGDQAVTNSGCNYLIFRTSWVYSSLGKNFMNTMLRLGREREALNIIDDQVGAPTPAHLIAQITLSAIERQTSSGIYHLTTRGETSWLGFAQEIFSQAQALEYPLMVIPKNITGIPTKDYPTPATRPLNSRMSLIKLEQALDIQLPDWRSQLALTLKDRKPYE